MSYVQQTIKEAVEGGYIASEWIDIDFMIRGLDIKNPFAKANMSILLLDPIFWQSLGKARGWDKKIVIRRGTVIGNFAAPPNSGNRGEAFEEMGFGMDYIPSWNYQWHRFIDHLAEGKDAESFFKSLLS